MTEMTKIKLEELDSRIILLNKISRDILKIYPYFTEIQFNILRYSELLKDSIRNFYEVENSNDVPLFKLCLYIKNGKDYYGVTDEEFDEIIQQLIQDVNKRFKVAISYKVKGKI